MQDLSIGTRVFYPSQGVAIVRALERRQLGAAEEDVYILELTRGAKLLVPRANLARMGVRNLVSVGKARALLAELADDPTELDGAAWRARSATYVEGLRSGSADRYTEILRELSFHSRSAKLSPHERRMLDVARGYFVGEIGAVLECPAQEIEAALPPAPGDKKPKPA